MGQGYLVLEMAPGSSYQATEAAVARLERVLQKHPEIEQTWVLSGSFSDHDGIARAGEFVWRKPQSMHETHSAEGCVILAIYRKPNIFRNSAGFEPGGKRIRTDRKPGSITA